MKIKCWVNQVDCFHQGIDAHDRIVFIQVDLQKLTTAQREYLRHNLVDGYMFDRSNVLHHIIPPTYEGFLEAVNRGVAAHLAKGSIVHETAS
jgi:hypothetical protein